MQATQIRDSAFFAFLKYFNSHSHGIAYQLIFSILICSSLITLISTAIQLYFDYSRDVELVEERMDQIQLSYLDGITNSIWVTDLNQAKSLMEGVVRLPDMQYAEFLLGQEKLVSVGIPSTENTIDRTFELKYKHEDQYYQLGMLHVVASLEGVYRRIFDKILIILLTQGVKTFVVSAFILIIVQWLVTRHLSRMAREARKMNAHTLDRPFRLNRSYKNDELGYVLDALNRMRDNLRISYLELKEELDHKLKLEKELTEYKTLLEDKVMEQTKELLEANKEINQSLEDKDILLREIHHRVKNNMQVISSMLRLQARHISDQKLLELFKEMQNRIQAMALVHENLYQSKNLDAVNTQEFVNSIVREIQDSYSTPGKRIQIHLDIAPIELDIDNAIPCGLIINELITNSFKYAFNEQESGNITLQIKKEDHKIQLIMQDDGIGIPEHIDPFTTKSMGLRLIVILSKQLQAEYQVERTHGAYFSITFEEER